MPNPYLTAALREQDDQRPKVAPKTSPAQSEAKQEAAKSAEKSDNATKEN